METAPKQTLAPHLVVVPQAQHVLPVGFTSLVDARSGQFKFE